MPDVDEPVDMNSTGFTTGYADKNPEIAKKAFNSIDTDESKNQTKD